jgi:hypothetical protein
LRTFDAETPALLPINRHPSPIAVWHGIIVSGSPSGLWSPCGFSDRPLPLRRGRAGGCALRAGWGSPLWSARRQTPAQRSKAHRTIGRTGLSLESAWLRSGTTGRTRASREDMNGADRRPHEASEPNELPRLPPRPTQPQQSPSRHGFTPAPLTYDELMRELNDPPQPKRKKKRRG